jgi:hypothetical protein
MEFSSEELVTVLNQFAKPAGEAIVNYYDPAKREYAIFFLYTTGESEQIKVPACRLMKCRGSKMSMTNRNETNEDRRPVIF